MSDVTDRMRADWDQRARSNARLYIADKESEGLNFTLSGCRDAFGMLEELHPYLRKDMRLLEIGCGIGRLLQFFAVIFDEVHGLDVSPEMIARGKEFLARFDNVRLTTGDGRSLGVYPDAHFDLVVSHHVFQHIPDKDVIRDYVLDARRVLRPGGILKFLVKTAEWEAQTEHDTWCGVEVGPEDIEAWCRAGDFEYLNAYSAPDGTTGWALFRVPEED